MTGTDPSTGADPTGEAGGGAGCSDREVERRLRALERNGEDRPLDSTGNPVGADRLAALERRLDDLVERVERQEAAVQALRGYVGNVRAVNREVERCADAALAAVRSADPDGSNGPDGPNDPDDPDGSDPGSTGQDGGPRSDPGAAGSDDGPNPGPDGTDGGSGVAWQDLSEVPNGPAGPDAGGSDRSGEAMSTDPDAESGGPGDPKEGSDDPGDGPYDLGDDPGDPEGDPGDPAGNSGGNTDERTGPDRPDREWTAKVYPTEVRDSSRTSAAAGMTTGGGRANRGTRAGRAPERGTGVPGRDADGRDRFPASAGGPDDSREWSIEDRDGGRSDDERATGGREGWTTGVREGWPTDGSEEEWRADGWEWPADRRIAERDRRSANEGVDRGAPWGVPDPVELVDVGDGDGDEGSLIERLREVL